MPYSPSRYAVHGRTRFSSSTIESTICAAAAPGAYHAEVPEELHDLAAADRRALDDLLDALLGDELADRDAADRRRRDDGDHLVAVAAEHDARCTSLTDAPVSHAMNV